MTRCKRRSVQPDRQRGSLTQAQPGNEVAITLSYVGVDRRQDRHQVEFWLVSLVRLFRQLVDRRLVPSRVGSRTTATGRRRIAFAVGMRGRIRRQGRRDRVSGSREADADRQRRPSPQRTSDHLLRRGPCAPGTKSTTLRSNVEKTIATLLPHGKARAAEVARRLGMSPRTLTRRLASQGLTFSGILEEQKTDLARHYLQEGHFPVSQIGWLLGYRELSAFTHAYKRWTGQPRNSCGSSHCHNKSHVAAPRTRRGQRNTP